MSYLKNNSILCFFFILFLITIVALFSFKSRGDIFVDIDSVDVAKIDVRNFVMHQMKKDIIDTLIDGSEATQYKDYEIFKDVTLSRMIDSNLFESIHSNYVHRNKEIYSFYDGVDYKRSDGFAFYSQAGVLNTSRELFKGKGNFKLSNNQGKVVGKNIVYDKKNSMVFAQKIHSKIFLEEGNR